MALVALPVAAAVVLATNDESGHFSTEERLTQLLGTTANARLTLGGGVMHQLPDGTQWTTDQDAFIENHEAYERADQGPRTRKAILAELPSGSRAMPLVTTSVDTYTPGEESLFGAQELDFDDPLAAGLFELVDGRLPRAPDEIVVTRDMDVLGVAAGSTLEVRPNHRRLHVVGTVMQPMIRATWMLIGRPGTFVGKTRWSKSDDYLLSVPGGMSWEEVKRWNALGWVVWSRQVIEHPPAEKVTLKLDAPSADDDRWSKAPWVLVWSMLPIEVILLASPAFVIGARRRRGELAVVAVQGGSRSTLRAVVLAEALVLGGTAALAGAGIGLGMTAAFRDIRILWYVNDGVIASLKVPWVTLLAIVALAVVTCVAAALVPAVQAGRTDAAAVLAGRRDPVRRPRALWWLGLILLALGAAMCVATVNLSKIGRPVDSAVLGLPAIVAGVVCTQLGLLMVAPAVVSVAGRVSGRLSLALRFAVRDAARNRHRTAPAIAAVMTVAAAACALGVLYESGTAAGRHAYRAELPSGVTRIQADEHLSEDWPAVVSAARAVLPTARLIEVRKSVNSVSNEFSVGDEGLLRLALGHEDPVLTAALGQGKAVVFDPSLVSGGVLTINIQPYTGQKLKERNLRIPAVVAHASRPSIASVIVPPEAMRKERLETSPVCLYVDPADHVTSPEEEERLDRMLQTISRRGDAYVERGYRPGESPFLRWATAVACVIALLATLLATALVLADTRRDLRTFAVVGASPGVRRRIAAAEAGFLALVGGAVGVVAGLGPGLAAAWGSQTQLWFPKDTEVFAGTSPSPIRGVTFGMPWTIAGLLVVIVPLVAALMAGMVTRSRVR
ncbi:FtsX-like permease family protein [Nonomuraea sediminis]|uniref:FtsX-like permease family protein n=1 Tax=Nonomuraea sediminis TaxID=2835864 RepID=UPI001BDC3F2F|nr:FtsX-like permease family protein [Nonomuraea sediminis]